jgi:MFS family permease
LSLKAISANSLLLNFTIICMTPDANFTSYQEGYLIAGTAVGGILAIGPVPPLISLIGLRLVFSTCGLLSGLATALLPFLFQIGGFWVIFGIRVLQGFCLMPAFPAISQITHHWANSAKRGQL